MNPKRLYPVFILAAMLAAGCGTEMHDLMSEDASRAQAIETLVGDVSMRGEVIDHLLNTPEARTALFEQIAADEAAAGALIEHMMESDRGKAVMANQIASDAEATRTFMGMMMLTGTVGEMMTHEQAECLDLGEAFAHGNQMRTMTDLKRLGDVIDGWAVQNDGSYPVCDDYQDVTACLASRLPADSLAELHLNDAWGTPIQYHGDADGKTYVLISYATDGRHDGMGLAGPTASYDADIVFSNGEFVQWPGHIRREAIR